MPFIVTSEDSEWGDGFPVVLEDGTPLPARGSLNFASGITATDNEADNTIDISVSGGGGGGDFQELSEKDQPGGYAGLDGDSKIAASQLPTAVTNVAMGNRILAMGDSITANGDNYTVAGTTGSPVTTAGLLTPSVNALSWHTWASMLSGGKIKYAGVTATGGMTSAQVVASHLTPAAAATGDAVLILCGRNDVVQTISAATTIANFKTICTTLLAAGKIPILCTLSPITPSPASAAQMLATEKLNSWIREQGTRNRWPVVDLHAAGVDPLTGNWTSGYNTDVSHPNVTGARVLGTAVASALAAWLPPCPTRLTDSQSAASSSVNVIQNALNLTDAGPDGIPDGWTKASGSGETSTIENPSGGDTTAGMLGKWWQITRSSGTNAIVYTYSPTMTVAAGDRVVFGCMISATVEAGSASVSAGLVNTANSNVVAGMSGWTSNITTPGQFVVEGVVPSGVTSLTARVALSLGPGTLKVGRLTAINLTSNGALT